MNMGKKILYINIILVLMCCLCMGCSSKKEKVNLSVWCDEDNCDFAQELIDEFVEKYGENTDFTITVSAESELTCKETVLANPKAAADIYTFADDQFEELCNAGALLEITENTDEIISENGGVQSSAIRASMYDGKLYAYPKTAGNGYFLYYNSAYFNDDDVKSFDKLLDVAAKNGKKVSMDFSSGWYIYSFFKSAGLDITANDDGVTNSCNWNSTDGKYTGVDVAEAMLDIACHDGFYSCADDELVKAIERGEVIAAVNGAWNAEEIKQIYGENYAATKLPEYTIKGDGLQMCSFTGYKQVGVNAYSSNPHWAMMFAQWVTNKENQLKRFHMTGECPSNVEAANSPEVQESAAVAALAKQAEYGYIQSVADTFWNPSCIFGTSIAAKNADNKDLQTMLDKMVADITAKPDAGQKSGEQTE